MNIKLLKSVLKFDYVVTYVTERFMLLDYLFSFHLYICYRFLHSFAYKLLNSSK